MSMQIGIEARAFRDEVGREEVLAWLEDARRTVAQANLHLACENEDPLRLGRAMEHASEADRALPQLIARRRKDRRSIA